MANIANSVDFTITLDWFEAHCYGQLDVNNEWEGLTEIEISENLFLLQEDYGTRHFLNRAKVIWEGRDFGMLLYNPRNSVIMNVNAVMFKAANHCLYESDFISQFKEVIATLGLKFKHLTKIDIAVDGKDLLQPVDEWLLGNVQKVGKAKIAPFLDGKRNIQGFHIGARSSDKMMKGYYKCAEIKQSNKTYIKTFWENSNLNAYTDHKEDKEQKVSRLEVTLKKKEIDRYEGGIHADNLELLQDVEYLSSLFQSTTKGLWEWVETGYSNITRAVRAFVLDLSCIGAKLLSKARAKVSNEVYKMKITAKQMYWLHLKTKRPHYLSLGREIARNIDHITWFEMMSEKWAVEWRNLMGKKHVLQYLPDWVVIEEMYEPRYHLSIPTK